MKHIKSCLIFDLKFLRETKNSFSELKHQTEGEIIAFIFMNFINALNIDDEI
jgi:hypothetical protein